MPVPGDRRDAREQRATLESYLRQNQAGLRVSRRDDGLQDDAHLTLYQYDMALEPTDPKYLEYLKTAARDGF
ncbi:hypothetical protein PG996_000207 [Apiospora saccharicola]|uniref:Uncharacterized protein n=1 Tax=Apiospora saccharicola TaxID=335842 RepID=A0ABR1WFY8_9PEZI